MGMFSHTLVSFMRTTVGVRIFEIGTCPALALP